MMERKIFCVSVAIVLVSSVVRAVALPSKGWAASGWTTESSHRSGWLQAPADDSQGKGWVSSESAPASKTKAVPTSWQQVDRHHGKSSGWTNAGQKTALNPASQEIANGFVVHHPIPSSKGWNQSPITQESWNKQNSEEIWQDNVNKKSSASSTTSSAAWEKAVADAKEQWQANDASKSVWDTKPAWEKSSDESLWNKNSSPSVWQNDALNDRESAAGYAATGPAQYGHGQESNGWQQNSQPTDDVAWNKDSSPSALYDAPSKWNNKPSSGNSDWQKASSGWDSSSSTDSKTWQKETNGWTDSGSNGQNHPALSGWQQVVPDVTTQNPWQKESASNGWH